MITLWIAMIFNVQAQTLKIDTEHTFIYTSLSACEESFKITNPTDEPHGCVKLELKEVK